MEKNELIQLRELLLKYLGTIKDPETAQEILTVYQGLNFDIRNYEEYKENNN